jgi:hypothetical protein
MDSEHVYLYEYWTHQLSSPAANYVYTETDPAVWRPPSKIVHNHKRFRKFWDFL